MNVKELVEILSAANPEAEVMFDGVDPDIIFTDHGGSVVCVEIDRRSVEGSGMVDVILWEVKE